MLPKTFCRLLLVLLLTLAPGWGAEATPEADAAWKLMEGASTLPNLPPEWQKAAPQDTALIRQTLRAELERLLALGLQARDFSTKYPQDTRRQLARHLASQALASAQKMGSATARTELARLDQERLADFALPREYRLDIRMRQVQTESEALVSKPDEARDKYELGARSLIGEFPDSALPWAMLIEVVDRGNDQATRTKLQEISSSNAPPSIKERANATLRRYDALGKPLELKFTALDGREVDLATLRGKTVIIHFWATWCHNCVEAMETMAKAYASLRELGVEIIGINLDKEKEKVEALVKEKGVVWPQFYEPAGTTNRIVRQWGITALPSLWLVDRDGVLRDLNGQADLTKKIEGLLSEKDEPPK